MPSILSELAVGVWGLFFVLVYAGAFAKGWVPNFAEAAVAFISLGLPTAFCILHWRIRREKKKGTDALYRKLLAMTVFNQT